MLLGLVLLAPAIARAQALDLTRGGPIEVLGDELEVHDLQHFAEAIGEARATRGDVTVTADRLIAHYRKKGGPALPAAGAKPNNAAPASGMGGNEIYRLEAQGHVHIFTPTDEAVGDAAVYDIDQAVLVMTGGGLKLTTPQQVITARDSLEYWSDKHMAVARGHAVVVTADAKRMAADTLVAYTKPSDAKPSDATPAVEKIPGKPASDPLASSGALERVEAYGNVEVRTATDTARGDRGLYLAARNSAWLEGNVRLTSADNGQLNGGAAEVNMKTGVAKLARPPGARVKGMIVPNKKRTP